MLQQSRNNAFAYSYAELTVLHYTVSPKKCALSFFATASVKYWQISKLLLLIHFEKSYHASNAPL